MIIFQITLTGPMLQYLAALKHQEETGVEAWSLLSGDGRFVTTMQGIIRQNLADHEIPINYKEVSRSTNAAAEYKFKGSRRFIYQITPKGQAALQLAGFDLQEFLSTIRKGLPGPTSPKHYEIYQDTPAAKKVRVGRGHRAAKAEATS